MQKFSLILCCTILSMFVWGCTNLDSKTTRTHFTQTVSSDKPISTETPTQIPTEAPIPTINSTPKPTAVPTPIKIPTEKPTQSTHLSSKDIETIMQKVDTRVTKVDEMINRDFYKVHYDRDILVFRYFNRDVDKETFAEYYLYYDEQGKLIYAEIAHYRDALYNIYFHNDELLHVEVGPFGDSDPYINGDMANVKSVIKKDPSYSFVLEDLSLILEHAYK